MSTNPVKLFAFVGIAAVIAAGMLSQNTEQRRSTSGGSLAAVPASASRDSGSWWSNLFAGMEFNTGGSTARRPSPPAAQPASAPVPQSRGVSGFGEITLTPDAGGQFHADVEIDGQRFPMLVDTGATVVALRYEDASSLGIYPTPGDFVVPLSTANGQLKAAQTTLREVRIDNLTVSNVQAVILPAGALERSLLGMSFLRKLSSFEIASGNLVLKP